MFEAVAPGIDSGWFVLMGSRVPMIYRTPALAMSSGVDRWWAMPLTGWSEVNCFCGDFELLYYLETMRSTFY